MSDQGMSIEINARVEYLAYRYFRGGDCSQPNWYLVMKAIWLQKRSGRSDTRARGSGGDFKDILGFEEYADRYGTVPTDSECFVAWIRDVSSSRFNSVVCVLCGKGPARMSAGCTCVEPRYAFCVHKSNIKAFLASIGRPCLALEKTLDGHTAASPATGEVLQKELTALFSSHEGRHPQCPYTHIPLSNTPRCDKCRSFPCRLALSDVCLIWRCHGVHNWGVAGCRCELLNGASDGEAPESEVVSRSTDAEGGIASQTPCRNGKLRITDMTVPGEFEVNNVSNKAPEPQSSKKSGATAGLWTAMTVMSSITISWLDKSGCMFSPTSPTRSRNWSISYPH